MTRSAIILTLLFLLAATPVVAVSVSFSNTPSSVDQNQEFDVDVSLSCSGCGDSYLRGVFYPSGTNYFGFTQNNHGDWIGTVSDKTQYFKLASSDMVEGSWSGKLKVKPDPTDSAFNGSGNYYFKIARYTSGGTPTWANEVSIAITAPSPTPTLTPTPTPTNTPTPAPTAAATATPTATNAPQAAATNTPTNTPTSVNTTTKTPTVVPSKTPTETITSISSSSTQDETPTSASNAASPEGEVLGEQTAVEESAFQKKKTLQSIVIAFLIIGAGLALLAIVFIWQKRNALRPEHREGSDDILI